MDNQSRLLNSDEQWNFSTDKYFYEIKNLKSITQWEQDFTY